VFIDKGIPAVIATSKPLADRYAVDFARRFYGEFTKPNSKRSLRQAFEAAFYSFTSQYGSLSKEMLNEKVRGSFDLDEEQEEQLYDLYINPAKKSVEQERFSEWMDLKVTTDTKKIRKELEDLISAGSLEEALTRMVDLIPDARMLKGQYASAKKENMMGLLDNDFWFRRQNQITYSALELLKQL
jgi:hypothetical protein